MTTTPNSEERSALVAEAARLLRKIEKTERRLARVRAEIKAESYPTEPTVSLITFQKQYITVGKTYDYAALRANGRWYITGSTAPQGITWRQLIDFIRLDNVAQAIYRIGVTVSSVAC